MSNEAFVTLATNDSYGLGALVLGRSLRRVATSKQTVVLVTPDVSQKMKDELAHVFNLVVTVDTLDSGDAAHLALMSRPELGVTFTKLHAWRLVQFSKCVFLDADTLVVQNCDELFEREELSAAPDPGWPDCFNSGVFVFVPSEATFKALMDFAVAHGSFDGGDQGLLNMFFSGWATGDIRKHLPFIYNVVSSATYSYLPALKHFGSQVKIAHFLGSNKPWLRQSQVGTSSPYQRAWWSIFREDVACRLSQDMAGVAGVLAAGEPDDWRREAWEAGDVDYLGRDSFDNIWKRICECVGITAQTLSAPAAPAATSAGIVNQPSAPVPVSEELIVPVSVAKPAGPLTEKPAEPATHPEKPTESVTSAEKPAEPPVSLEKLAEAIISVEKQVEPAVCPVKPVEPVVSTEKPVEPVVSTEKSVEPVVSTEKPVEPVLSTEKPVEPLVLAEKIVEPEVSAAKPAETDVSREKPTELVSVEKPAETAVSTDKPKEIVSAEKPTEPVVSAQKSVEPVVSLEKPAETVVTHEKPVEPITTSEKLPETVVVEKPSELSAILEKQTPLSEKLPEAAPVTDKPTTTVDKDKTAEITPTKAVEIPEGKIVEPTSAEEKSAKQKAPEKEKPLETAETSAVPVAIMPAKTATAEKPEETAIILKEQPKEVQAEKKVEPAPTLEKPVDVPPTAETPAGKSGEHTPESVKPKETPAAAEVCPLKPSEPKSSATETPVGGEARIQPPLVAGEAPACKKEPGTPTITPPSGPGSPQPADTPPEVCKLQATPSQPATPPASSHQTADAPVPPKRKQGKNGKSGKGKK